MSTVVFVVLLLMAWVLEIGIQLGMEASTMIFLILLWLALLLEVGIVGRKAK